MLNRKFHVWFKIFGSHRMVLSDIYSERRTLESSIVGILKNGKEINNQRYTKQQNAKPVIETLGRIILFWYWKHRKLNIKTQN